MGGGLKTKGCAVEVAQPGKEVKDALAPAWWPDFHLSNLHSRREKTLTGCPDSHTHVTAYAYTLTHKTNKCKTKQKATSKFQNKNPSQQDCLWCCSEALVTLPGFYRALRRLSILDLKKQLLCNATWIDWGRSRMKEESLCVYLCVCLYASMCVCLCEGNGYTSTIDKSVISQGTLTFHIGALTLCCGVSF